MLTPTASCIFVPWNFDLLFITLKMSQCYQIGLCIIPKYNKSQLFIYPYKSIVSIQITLIIYGSQSLLSVWLSPITIRIILLSYIQNLLIPSLSFSYSYDNNSYIITLKCNLMGQALFKFFPYCLGKDS